MPAAARGSEDVEPEMNHRSSRLVVSRGRIGVPVGEESSNLRGRGAKRERVPVPVLQLSARVFDVLEADLPVRPMLSCLQDFANQVEILVFFMLIEACGARSKVDHFRCDASCSLGVHK
jgi:hypothetical protein